MKKNNRLVKGWLLIVGVAFLFGCYPGGPEYTNQYNIVLTRYDKDYNFASKKTYYMIDTIAYISNIKDPDYTEAEKEAWESALFNSIEENMNSRDYTRLDSAQAVVTPPDLVVLASTIGIKNSGTVWMPPPGWWGGYYPGYPGGGWGPGYGWWYPPGWWGGYPVSYSYSTGTVIILMADEETSGTGDLEDLVALEWNAVIDGLLSGVIDASSIDKKIDQAFIQSPYLQSN